MPKRWRLSLPRLRASGVQMQNASRGRLRGDVAAGDPAATLAPAPEYIEKAGEPSEDAWAHEQELYRRKRGEPQQ